MTQRVQRRARRLAGALAAVVLGTAGLAIEPAGAQLPPDGGTSSASSTSASNDGATAADGSPPSPGTPPSAGTPGADPAGPAAIAASDPQATVVWGDCGGGDVAPQTGGSFQCARVRVPVEHGRPGGTALSLALVRLPASDPDQRRGSLLVNPGGPGGSGVALALSIAPLFDAEVRARYDIVGFDPRGVGASGGLSCGVGDELLAPDSAAARPARAAQPEPSAPGSVQAPAESSELTVAASADPTPWSALRLAGAVDLLLPAQVAYGERLARACEAEAPGQLAALGTAAAAHDLDLLRAAVGDEQLHYLGYSYGSTLGATYAELYPDRVGRLVLDGAAAPNQSYLDWVSDQMVSFEDVLGRFLTTCAAEPTCPLRRAAPVPATAPGTAAAPVPPTAPGTAAAPGELGPAAVWDDLLGRAGGVGLATSRGPALRRAELLDATVGLLYLGHEYYGLLATLLHNADRGDAAGLAELAARSSGISAAAYYGVVCADDPSRPDPATVGRRMAELATLAPTFADGLREVLTCAALGDTGPARPAVAVAAGESAPILLVATTNDPATPYQGALALSTALRSATLLTFEGDGHTAVLRGNRCIDAAVTRYLLVGEVPDPGARCRPVHDLGVILSARPDAGAVVTALAADSVANGRLLVGDVIRSVNGEAIRSPLQLDEVAQRGDEVVVALDRAGRRLTVRFRPAPPDYWLG